MLQRITPIFALAMVILGITCPGTSEGFAIERHWKLHDSTQETNICRLSLGAENYEKFAGICDECSAVFNVNEMHGLCQGNCFNSEYFKGCLGVLEASTEMPVPLNNLIDITPDYFFVPRPREEEEKDEKEKEEGEEEE